MQSLFLSDIFPCTVLCIIDTKCILNIPNLRFNTHEDTNRITFGNFTICEEFKAIHEIRLCHVIFIFNVNSVRSYFLKFFKREMSLFKRECLNMSIENLSCLRVVIFSRIFKNFHDERCGSDDASLLYYFFKFDAKKKLNQ